MIAPQELDGTRHKGGYQPLQGNFEQLSRDESGNFVLLFKNQTRFIYGADGKLISMMDNNDHRLDMQYGSDGKLNAVLSDDGRSLVFTYNSIGKKRSDYGDWGLPGGGMKPGESIQETMVREVCEETGLSVKDYELYAIYSGPRMEYTHPDGNKVVFVMFLFNSNGCI
jgi:hypothetical protein